MKRQKDSLNKVTKRLLAILLAGILMVDPCVCSMLEVNAAESQQLEELSDLPEERNLEQQTERESQESEVLGESEESGNLEEELDSTLTEDQGESEEIQDNSIVPKDEVCVDGEAEPKEVDDSEEIVIDQLSFPDKNLREIVAGMIDSNQDGVLTDEECKAVLSLDISHSEIATLKGLEYFGNLKELDCSWNHLSRAEVEPYLGLEKIQYFYNTYLVETPEEAVEETQEIDPEEEAKQPGADQSEAGGSESDEPKDDNQLTDIDDLEESIGISDLVLEGAYENEAQTVNNQDLDNQDLESQIQEVKISNDQNSEDQVSNNQTSNDQNSEDQTLNDQASEEQISEAQEQKKTWKFTFISIISSEDFPEEVPLDESNFPDEVFRRFLAEAYDKDQNLILSREELKSITSLYVKDSQIQDLTGIAWFKNLLLLECSTNQLTELNTEELLELRGLYCKENQIETLDLTNNINLKQLECDEHVEVIGWMDPSQRIQEENTGNPQLEAETKEISVGRAKVKKLSNPKKEILRMTYGKVSGAKGYDVQISTVKNFKSGLRRVFTTKLTQDFDRMYKGKTYYARVRAYKLDSANKRVYGAFSPVKSIKITEGRISVNPSANAATLKSVSLVSTKTVRIQASAPNYVKSVDGYYYLFNLTLPESKLPAGRKPIAKKAKRRNIVFNVSLYRGTQHDRLTRQFAIGVKTSKTSNQYQLITGAKFISNPEKLATSNRAFPKSSTKKGLQVNEFYISDAAKLGIKHTTYNMCLDDMIATGAEKNNTRGIPFTYNGKTYWFDKGVIESYDRTLNAYKQNNMIVSAIILLRYRNDLTYLMPYGVYQSGFYALNTTTAAARAQLAATFTFLAKRYAADGRIANWIIGNEVNNYGTYHYTGSSSVSRNAKIYTNAFRLAYISIRSVYSKARLYISLDHLWNTLTATGHGSKQFLNAFAKYWNSYGKFNIAYHPYPSPLTAPEFWKNTNGAISNSYNSACVNMGNLQVLTNYVKKKFGSGTRIILSEQGFTSRKSGVSVEKAQATAIAYAYYLAEFNDMIDAFILHRHIDHQVEINQGLALGLWTNKAGTIETMGTKKYAWNVYKYVDTAQGAKKTAFALPIIGKGSWKMAVPGYNASRFS